mgnify:CR=1 FL=1
MPKNNSEPESTRKQLQLPKQYLLFVGNRASYKQFPYAAKLGIPVIEAQRCGCPVIAYNASSIPEVIGEDYPLLLHKLDVSVASNWINQLLTNQSFRNSIRTQGIENSLRFSWDKMQESYQALYTQLWAEHTSQTK